MKKWFVVLIICFGCLFGSDSVEAGREGGKATSDSRKETRSVYQEYLEEVDFLGIHPTRMAEYVIQRAFGQSMEYSYAYSWALFDNESVAFAQIFASKFEETCHYTEAKVYAFAVFYGKMDEEAAEVFAREARICGIWFCLEKYRYFERCFVEKLVEFANEASVFYPHFPL